MTRCHKINNNYLQFLMLFILLLLPSISHAWYGKVVHVADGDTITVMKSGQKVKVRLYGIDAPEFKQWYGQNAKAFTSSQVMGKQVDVQWVWLLSGIWY